MARNLSTQAIEALNRVNSGDVFIWLLKLYNPSFADVYVCNNNESVISNGITYNPYAFNLVLENDDENPPKIRLTVDNVDRSLVDDVRQTQTPINVDLLLVLQSQPDTVEIEYNQLTLRNVTYNKSVISGQLAISEVYLNVFPAHTVNPTDYAGVY